MKICAIVPSHNHYQALPAVLQRVRAHLPDIFVIDDGSGESAGAAIAGLHDPENGVRVVRRPARGGKGKAVADGLYLASKAGFSHAFQIDADGQHDLGAIPEMLACASANPAALISGKPVFDASIPTSRKIGRWITHIWVWIETLSFDIPDSMCGFRIYPLAATLKTAARRPFASHMDFDTDIMVRLFWAGTPIIFRPVAVTYPRDNISNFDTLRDNIRIAWMHTKLVTGMLMRLPGRWAPSIAASKRGRHWSKLAERGTYLGLSLTAAVASRLGKSTCLKLLTPVAVYFYLTGGRQRRAAEAFLTRALGRQPRPDERYRLFSQFVERSLDVFLAWIGKLPAGTVVAANRQTEEFLERPEGSLIIVAHIGNANIAQALLTPAERSRMVVLVHTKHAASFNRLLREFNPSAGVDQFEVTEIGPETVIDLSAQIEAGRHIVIAGDRTSAGTEDTSSHVPFLGRKAPFPQGPWILASLLECPVHLLFCMKDGQDYRLTIELFRARVELPRQTRRPSLDALIEAYAHRLEQMALCYPLQWYNFFDFWDEPQ